MKQHTSLKKTISAVILLGVAMLSTMCFLTGCSFGKNDQGKDAILQRLTALDDVVSASAVKTGFISGLFDEYKGRYVVEFEQPISWDNPELGTFHQRALVCYKGTENVTCYYTTGYILKDIVQENYFKNCTGNELDEHYDSNFVALEYRFFGQSVPDGLSRDSEKYWEYMNSENASKDFAHIIDELDSILTGSTLFYGGSKGGYTTENMAFYCPEAVDAYVSYVAPLCDGVSDKRLYSYVNNNIGDLDYGPEQAAIYRAEMLEMQKLLLEDRYRKIIQTEYIEKFDGVNATLSDLVTEDEAYEMSVGDSVTQTWQYDQNFEKAEKILAMSDESQEDFEKKAFALKEWFFETDPVLSSDCANWIFPYYVQSYTEMGNYMMDLSYLRNAGANVKTPAENDETLYIRLCCPLVAKSSTLKYSDEHRKELIEYFKTTDREIVKIVGKSDPWYSVRMPDTGNANVHVYQVNKSHRAAISDLSKAEQNECYGIIDSMLGM